MKFLGETNFWHYLLLAVYYKIEVSLNKHPPQYSVLVSDAIVDRLELRLGVGFTVGHMLALQNVNP